jgi:hypothetical protein
VAEFGKQTRTAALDSTRPGTHADAHGTPGKTSLTGALPPGATAPASEGPDAPRDLAANERVLSKDPKYASESYLDWFRKEIHHKLNGWDLPWDPAAVSLATIKLGKEAVKAVVLAWNPEWGQLPDTREFPLTMTPLDARASVKAVHALPGWHKVKHADQPVITHLLVGEENVLSTATREHLRPHYKHIKTENETKQAHTIEATIHVKNALPGWEPEPMAKELATFTLSGPHVQKDFAFRGKTADADVSEAHYSDHVKVKIIAPKGPTPGYHNHTVHQAADAAAHMPKSARSVIKEIMLNPVTNPDDPHWAAVYHQPHFHSYMTAGADGIVTIYPDKTSNPLPDKNAQRSAMTHETGHTWSFKHWGTDETKGKWLDWKHAMQADKTSVSGYATSAIAEDVAETIRVYVSTKHTPRHEEYQRIVPHRFAILKKEYDK